MKKINIKNNFVKQNIYMILNVSPSDISMLENNSDNTFSLVIKESSTRTSSYKYDNYSDLSDDYEELLRFMNSICNC